MNFTAHHASHSAPPAGGKLQHNQHWCTRLTFVRAVYSYGQIWKDKIFVILPPLVCIWCWWAFHIIPFLCTIQEAPSGRIQTILFIISADIDNLQMLAVDKRSCCCLPSGGVKHIVWFSRHFTYTITAFASWIGHFVTQGQRDIRSLSPASLPCWSPLSRVEGVARLLSQSRWCRV